MALLRVKNLRFHGLHGHLDFEKVTGNTFEIDVEATFTLSGSDRLADVPDYSRIAKMVRAQVHGPSVDLIETLAARMISTLRTEWPFVQQWSVSVRKLRPPMEPSCDYTEIVVTWPDS